MSKKVIYLCDRCSQTAEGQIVEVFHTRKLAQPKGWVCMESVIFPGREDDLCDVCSAEIERIRKEQVTKFMLEMKNQGPSTLANFFERIA